MMFSIIIPLYNKEKFLFETLSSVELQTYKDFEVIIVDDSSTDNSFNIAKTFEKDKRFKVYTKLNGGVSDARNFGIEKAVGQYICFLDADDIWDSSYLREVYRLIKKYPDYDVFCLGYSSFNNVIKDAHVKYNLRKYIKTDDAVIDFFRYSVLRKGSIALTSAVVISQKLIERNQLKFPKGCSMGEDVDFWARACALKDIVYSNKSKNLLCDTEFSGKYCELDHLAEFRFEDILYNEKEIVDLGETIVNSKGHFRFLDCELLSVL